MQSTLFYPPFVAWAALSLCLLLSPLQAQDLHITLLNGDCDGDNEVTLFDLGIVVNAFGSTPNDPNWDPRADLDGDLEVTLLDYGIVVRNFGAVGAEPFDPALPRQPAPSEGYVFVKGAVEVECWEGEGQTVRIEALRDDDPDQVVYWKEVQTGEPFTFVLPEQGVWTFHVGGAAHALASTSSYTREYYSGPPVVLILVGPEQGEEIADARFGAGSIAVEARFVDYDLVRQWPAQRRGNPLVNREIQPAKAADSSGNEVDTFRFTWEVSGAQFILRDGNKIEIGIPHLEENEPDRDITVRCTVTDAHPVRQRQDPPRTATLTFKIVNHPTIRPVVTSAVGTPVTSGFARESKLVFSIAARPDNVLQDEDVEWNTPWGTSTGRVFETAPVSPDAGHQFFSYTVTARFRGFGNSQGGTLPPPPGSGDYVVTKTGKAMLAFDLLDYDEWNDTSRGQSNWGLLDKNDNKPDRNDNPPNWFDDRPNHWGSVIPRMNEKVGGQYIVHFADIEVTDERGNPIVARFDWKGEFAPRGHRYDPAYRGRVYLFRWALHKLLPERFKPYGLTRSQYGVASNGIDYTAMVVAHELAHRDLFIRSWEGFTDELIGGPDNWKPGSGLRDVDEDKDEVADAYERNGGGSFHFSPDSPNAILRWWTGDPNREDDYFKDAEMYAQLWGEWDGYLIGSLVITDNGGLVEKDWSRGGWLDYFYPRGK